MAKKKRKKEAEAQAGFGQPQGRARLTPVDVQEKVFRLSAPLTRGYNEQDVDEFLDQITEELAHLHEDNKRLREKLEMGGGGGSESVAQAQQQAAEILRQAREQAAQMTAGAGQAAGTSAPPAGFLIRERDFLQQMAALIQGHAEALKADARRGKASEAAAQPPPAPPQPEMPEGPAATGLAGAAAVGAAAPSWEGESTQAHDPLLDEWEEDVAPKGEAYEASDLFGEPPTPEEPESEDLRELFWGEDA